MSQNLFEPIITEIKANLPMAENCGRLFHGRGHCFPGFEHLAIDQLGDQLLLSTFQEDDRLHDLCRQIQESFQNSWTNIILQERYIKNGPMTALHGEVPEYAIVEESGTKYQVYFGRNQNIGLFLDMKNGRDWVKANASGKKVLNLFAYTCSLSVVAVQGGAQHVLNVDMSRGALNKGRNNHKINGVSTKQVKFLPHDIMRSFGSLIKKGPFDLVIIDPPTNQGDSFQADRDYQKIVRRLPEFLSDGAMVVACLNDPSRRKEELNELFSVHADRFKMAGEIAAPSAFKEAQNQDALKISLLRYSM